MTMCPGAFPVPERMGLGTRQEVVSMHRLLLIFGGALLFVGCGREVRYEPPPPVTPDHITDLKDAWVALYKDTNFTGDRLTIKYPNTQPDLGSVHSDNGAMNGFAKEAKSVKWQIPDGWQAVLYSDTDFKGDKFPLVGTGKIDTNTDLGRFAGEAKSIRWERTTR
jgi:hypothetical protein